MPALTWTAEQIALVRKLAGRHSVATIARRVSAIGPEHTASAISVWGARHGVKLRPVHRPRRNRYAWSTEETNLIRAMAGRHSVEEIAREIAVRFRTPRSVGATQRQANKIGVSMVRGDGIAMAALCAVLAIDPVRIRREVAAGRLRAERQGNSHRGSLWLFLPGDIEAWLRAHPYMVDWRRVRQGRWRNLARAGAVGAPHLSVTEAEGHLGIDRKLIQTWIRRGEIVGIANAGTSRKPIYRIPLSALDRIEQLAGTRKEAAA
jgi:hypothetical protein